MKKFPLKPRPAGTVLNSPHFLTVVANLAVIRTRQLRDLREGAVLFDLSSPIVDEHRKLRVLTECTGAIAQAVADIEVQNNLNNRCELRAKLENLAAHTFAWLQALETKPTTKGTK